MKNIVSITLTVLAVLGIGFLVFTFNKGVHQTSYLPNTFTTTDTTYTLFQREDDPVNKTVYLGYPKDNEKAFQVESTLGHYVRDNKLAITLWVEKLPNIETFESYKEKAWERYSAPERASTSEQVTIQDHDVFLSFRKIDELVDDTSKMITMGGGYVFLPEDLVIVAYTVYNPRLYSCEDLQKPESCLFNRDISLPLSSDNRSIAEQIVANKLGIH